MPPIAALAISPAEGHRSCMPPAQMALALLPGIQPVTTRLDFLALPVLGSGSIERLILWRKSVAWTLVRRHGDTHGH
ncbi:hypothetical protein GCM10023165_20350 [Variovorax defluvii]|uniref:Uncharacterized protein n=1 Tax=Variovorax defluvii TaxID=913761 RepID=A0ABP8HK82_9BURK